ncbi:MAG: amidohydrolase family protein [Planctomycetes bacterium]|nr:amidohydrolase family protein [Planctomycetota bacterium]
MSFRRTISAVATSTLLWCLAALASCSSSGRAPDLAPLRPGEEGLAIRCGRVLTVDDHDRAYGPGLILLKQGRIAYVGPDRDVPEGYPVEERRDLWAAPGMVELHAHVHGTMGDINDMVFPVNADLRASPTYVPGNRALRLACAGGVTTLFGIPGSGTSIGGFGITFKSKVRGATYDGSVVQDPGGMKVAQSYNPERRAGDLGATRAGLSWILEQWSEEARVANREGRVEPLLENLQKVHARELPVLIHSAGSDGYPAAARMWHAKYGTRAILSHGCFDAHLTAPWLVAQGVPLNVGPREIDFFSTRDGAITGTAARYLEAGAKDLSLNTDSPVVPQEELFLQGAVAARYGADAYTMLRAVTIAPARVFGIGDRVGSLEVGKDADVVLFTGEPLDPRSRVEVVFIDGRVEYDRRQDGQWF